MTDTPSPNPALPDREAKKHADRLRIMLQQGGETWLDGDAEAALQAGILALSSPSGVNEGRCFECDAELHAPFCPACNPEMVSGDNAALVEAKP